MQTVEINHEWDFSQTILENLVEILEWDGTLALPLWDSEKCADILCAKFPHLNRPDLLEHIEELAEQELYKWEAGLSLELNITNLLAYEGSVDEIEDMANMISERFNVDYFEVRSILALVLDNDELDDFQEHEIWDMLTEEICENVNDN